MTKPDIDQWNADQASRMFGSRTAQAIHDGIRGQKRRELSQILNTRPDPIDQRDFLYEPSLINIPARYFNSNCTSVDFRVKEQGAEGTCVGQALASLIEMQCLEHYRAGAKVPQRVSARFLYANAQLYDHHPDDSLEGASLRGAIKGFYHNGSCDEMLARYRVQHKDFRIEPEMWEDAQKVALGTYFRLEHVLNHYHCALKESGSILCSAIIHDGWKKESVAIDLPKKDQFPGHIKYREIISKRNGRGFSKKQCQLSGGHAFVIVGYDDTGFLVLNSWGSLWGRYPVQRLNPEKSHAANGQEFEHPLGDTTLSGIAHWSYEDWADNVLDAWILRLAAPTGHGTDFIGGRPGRSKKDDKRSGTARKRDVQSHYMHLRDGKLVKEPPYENDFKQFSNLAKKLRNDSRYRKYRHVALFAHGGLNTIDSASARAAAMIPTFKNNGIYPLFYFWRTGFGHMLGSIIQSILPEIEQRSQDYTELKDVSIERLARPIGRAIWNDIRRNAAACFDKNHEEHCEKQAQEHQAEEANGNAQNSESSLQDRENAWCTTREFINICTDDSDSPNRPLKIHLIGHSAGVFLLGQLIKRLEQESILHKDWLGSVNLMVPCCSSDYFKDTVLPVCNYLGKKRLTIFNLRPSTERNVDPSMDPYGKSFASLASNAFYDRKPESIAALHDFWVDDIEPDITSKGFTPKVDYVQPDDTYRDGTSKCSAAYHGEFDNDADTMNYILNKILSKSREKSLTPTSGGFTFEQLNHRGF